MFSPGPSNSPYEPFLGTSRPSDRVTGPLNTRSSRIAEVGRGLGGSLRVGGVVRRVEAALGDPPPAPGAPDPTPAGIAATAAAEGPVGQGLGGPNTGGGAAPVAYVQQSVACFVTSTGKQHQLLADGAGPGGKPTCYTLDVVWGAADETFPLGGPQGTPGASGNESEALSGRRGSVVAGPQAPSTAAAPLVGGPAPGSRSVPRNPRLRMVRIPQKEAAWGIVQTIGAGEGEAGEKLSWAATRKASLGAWLKTRRASQPANSQTPRNAPDWEDDFDSPGPKTSVYASDDTPAAQRGSTPRRGTTTPRPRPRSARGI